MQNMHGLQLPFTLFIAFYNGAIPIFQFQCMTHNGTNKPSKQKLPEQVTVSVNDIESNSFPIGEKAFSKRAANPSKKSKTAANMIQTTAYIKLPSSAMTEATQPDTRFRQVIVLGI